MIIRLLGICKEKIKSWIWGAAQGKEDLGGMAGGCPRQNEGAMCRGEEQDRRAT